MKGTRNERTVTISLDARGQTAQDFAVGIGVFLLAIAFVFSYVPTLIGMDETQASAGASQADRIADTIVDELEGDPNDLQPSDEGEFEDAIEEMDLGQREDIDRVNVRIEALDGTDGPDWTAGDEEEGQSVASSARIVTADESECDPACRLVVRVW